MPENDKPFGGFDAEHRYPPVQSALRQMPSPDSPFSPELLRSPTFEREGVGQSALRKRKCKQDSTPSHAFSKKKGLSLCLF